MIVVYKAYDGTEFTNEKDCYEYEKELRDTVRMWNREGLVVSDPDLAVYVELGDERSRNIH